MNNNRNQPIYDNKKLKDAGKYSFENVNAINKRSGEMIFDSTLPLEKKLISTRFRNVILFSVISVLLLLSVSIFSFTDAKNIILPKTKEPDVKTEVNFESLDVIHTMVCVSETKKEQLRFLNTKTFLYNNDKLKIVKHDYQIEVTKQELVNDSSYHQYMKKYMQNIVDTYKNIDGIDLQYRVDNNIYYYSDEIDLKKLSSNPNYVKLTDVYYDQSIKSVEVKATREGFSCSKE